MNKLFYLLTFIFCAGGLQAQFLSPKVIGNLGMMANTSSGGVTLSYTVGQPGLISTFQKDGNTLTQGFQQPNEVMTGLMEQAVDPSSFLVYPCPAVTQVWMGFQLPESGKVSILLFNNIGQNVMQPWQFNYTGGKIIEDMNVSNYAAGTYILILQFTADKDGKKTELSRKLEIVK
jgi:hypothetical protein